MFIKSKKFISYNKNLKERASKMRREMTAAESKLWFEFLRGHEHRFVRQKIIGSYIVDFYCQKLKLGIELDGETHLGDNNERKDFIRTQYLNEVGVEIIRFWNNDIFEGLGEVEEIINNLIIGRGKMFNT